MTDATLDFGDILRRSARQWPENVATNCGERAQTYAEMFARACRLANALGAKGLEPGDRVALLGPNAFETVEQIAGIALGGFVRCALYAHETPEVNGYLADHVDARVLIVQAGLAQGLLDRREELPRLEHVVVYDGPAPNGALGYEELLAGADGSDPLVRTAPDDLHVIRFSAGTTGRPKGIVHTVDRWLAIGDEYRWVTPQLDERDVYLALGPLTHAAIIFLWPILQVGGRVAISEAFEPGRALELIESERATVTLMVPAMIQAMATHADAETRDLSSLRCLNYAASPISERTIVAAQEAFGDEVLFQMYGQSEAVPVTMLLPHEHRGELNRSVGRPTPRTVLTIVDDGGNPLPPGEIGEVAARTPGQMVYQWKDPEGTAERTLEDGSLLTRDMGYLDEHGFLYLADRKQDLIISGGYNIWPAQLERALTSHAAVADACVVGVPHERWGESPKGVVVLEEGASVTEEELIELTRERVGSVQKVTSIDFVETIPRSAIGKILRREVRERYWEGREERVGRT